MLRLSPDQLEPLERLQRERASEGLARAMAGAWPEVAERLQSRWPAFVTTALEQAHQLGLATLAEQARFASLCCLWGVGFVGKPGFEWAQAIAQAPGASPALRLHQLTHRSRVELVQRQAAAGTSTSVQVLPPAAFDTALAAVEAGLGGAARSHTVFIEPPPPPATRACDIATLSWAVAEPKPLQVYARIEGAWQRVPAAPGPSGTTTLTIAPEEPPVLGLLSRAVGEAGSARLNLALQMQASCDLHQGAQRHPVVTHLSGQGRLSWAGPDAQRLSLALHAPAAPPVDGKLGPPGLGFGTPPDGQTVSFAHCGLRDAGAPFGPISLALEVHSATQHLLELRHGALPTLALPAPLDGDAAPASAPAVCRLEADGTLANSSAWLQAWRQLQPQCLAGFERLFNAWGRQLDTRTARLDGSATPMVGQASLSWGWQHGKPTQPGLGLRVLGAMDWAALVLDIRLSGTIDLGGPRAHLSLTAQGRADWQMQIDQSGLEAHPPAAGQALTDAVRTWRHPFTLNVDPLAPVAGGESALVSALPLPVPLQGALLGECGLRLRPDGQGWQWFYKLSTEAVHALLCVHDPVHGQRTEQRVLLPAMSLLDWSAG